MVVTKSKISSSDRELNTSCASSNSRRVCIHVRQIYICSCQDPGHCIDIGVCKETKVLMELGTLNWCSLCSFVMGLNRQHSLGVHTSPLVKNTPHAHGMLFVGVAPHKHVGEGSDVRSLTKISNLETHEFSSNPSRHFHFLPHFW